MRIEWILGHKKKEQVKQKKHVLVTYDDPERRGIDGLENDNDRNVSLVVSLREPATDNDVQQF